MDNDHRGVLSLRMNWVIGTEKIIAAKVNPGLAASLEILYRGSVKRDDANRRAAQRKL
jgi:hypothetical protein